MSDVLNYYLQKYGVIDTIKEDIKADTNEKAKKRWELLRKSICSVSDIVEKRDLTEIKVSHGIEFIRRINHINEIEQAIFIPIIDSYLTLDGCSVRLFDLNGRCKNSIAYSDINVKFKRLEYAICSERFIAWTPDEVELTMLNSTFEIIEKVDAILIENAIKELFYNEDKNEIITSHGTYLVIWQFRYANKHLIPRSTINLNYKGQCAKIFTIERTQRKFQRLFVVNDCGVTVVELSKGVVIADHLPLHERPITTLTFFNPLKFLVTGCKDGSIKVWYFVDNDIKLKMVFVGHTSYVNNLAFFPGGSQATIASCGDDKTLRVWSLELDDEVECLDLEYTSKFIGSDITKTSFFTLSNNFLDIWHQNHLSDDLMSLTTPVSGMLNTNENNGKILVYCRNNLVFYITPGKNAKVITKSVIGKVDKFRSQTPKIFSTLHLENRNSLLVLIQENQILQYNTKTNPMLLVSITQCVSEENLVILTVYKPSSEISEKAQSKSLILSGSNQGIIKVHDLNKLDIITFQIEAHPDSEIVCMISDPPNSKLYTSGLDNTIKIWYIYPFATEPLSKILSFFCGLLPFHLISINNYLFTVFHDSDGAHYPCVVYNIQTRERFDHSPSDDHIEPVNSVSACNRMKLFLSCSAGTENMIKIWTQKNILLRQIEMHFPVYSAIFSSLKGDIMLGLGHQICYIDHIKYLPKAYIKKQVLMYFDNNSDLEENSLVFDDDNFKNKFDSEDRDKMKGIKPVFRYDTYIDILTEIEKQELLDLNEIKNENLNRLKKIDNDIRNIKNGDHVKPKRKYEHLIETPLKSDIFNNYFSQIVKLSKILLPNDTDKIQTDFKTRFPDKYIKSEKEGFFPSADTISNIMAPNNLKTGGYIPNSAVLQKLWPPKLLKEKADTWKPLMLSALDLQQMELSKIINNDENDEDETKIFDWGSDEEPEPEQIIMSPTPSEIISENLSDDLLSKFGSLLESKQSVSDDIKDDLANTKSLEPETPKEIKRPITTKMTRENLKLPSISRNPASMPEIKRVRFVSSAEDIPEEIKPLDVSNDKEQYHSDSTLFITQVLNQDLELKSIARVKEKQSVLPEFLIRFQGQNWFERICPPPYQDEKCLSSLPSPLNSNNFTMYIVQILNNLKDDNEKYGIVNAIIYLYSNENIDKQSIPQINKTIQGIIKEMRLDNAANISLFKSCLHLMASLEGVSDKTLVTICLSRHFDADEELKAFLKSILYHIGLEDNADTVEQELQNFKLFSIEPGPGRIGKLYDMVSEWLEKWFQSMTTFAIECRETIRKELHLIGSSYSKLSKSTITCLDNVKNVFHCHIMSSADLVLLYPVDKNPKSILNYINCLNYFRFKKLQRQTREKSVLVDPTIENIGPKKTIVSLPKLNPNKQCLVRLGESNALGIETKSKKDFITLNSVGNKFSISDYTQHPSMQPFHHYQVALGGGFVPFLHLHLKPCLVNPFPNEDDLIELEHSNPKSLFGSYNKAFIPQFSLPPEPF